ncbi:hypothetical protein [Lentilitoribacter sp. EG35]|uniref:hypothetical protein n=1 Tax=Lentilitoribacter sp. EG35 TaxID=3234192 RepID=UPI00345F73C1
MLRFFLLVFSLGFTCHLATAQNQSNNAFNAEQVFSVATGDWNNDETPDAAMIMVTNEHQFDLLIYQSDKQQRLKLHSHMPDFVWGSDVMYGQEPSVIALKNGSINVTSQNSAIGRNRWEQNLTIAYRGGEFLVAGFSYSYYDTLDVEANGGCDLNLLTGRGTVDDLPIKLTIPVPTVKNFAKFNDILIETCLKTE